ncbi:MAG TPA: phosphoribosylanthranilate isomerase [Solirubrobacteraceae bacterium]|jgi:phosphoribosylanthranilate isomerase|nr:phosphoribosylanthranilate isomerase [Solirubrobacteraceae bacterium]
MSTRIKFCGITRPADAELAVSLDAWAIGMILWPGSPRAVSPDVAAGIAADVRRKLEIAGVFVNPTLDEVTRSADVVGLTLVQLHGQEGPAFCAEVARRTGCRVIKAARVRGSADIQALASFHTDFHLLDSYRRGQPGGTGEAFAWELVAGRRADAPLILSGGLTADNVAEAIRTVRPFAVDVASGVEASPGVKDANRTREFARAVADTVRPLGDRSPSRLAT